MQLPIPLLSETQLENQALSYADVIAQTID